MKPNRLLAPLLAWATLASCAQTAPTAPAVPVTPGASAAETDAARLARELRSMIGPAACTADDQCRTLAVGAKACGGPDGYWAWSSTGTDEAKLRDLAQRQAQAAAAENRRSGMLSNCSVVTDPGARCQAGRCVLRQPGEAPTAR
jgi:hypothetical protein